MSEVERVVRYTAQVDTLAEVWAFIMAYVDEFEHPAIEVKPYLAQDADDESAEWTHHFGATIYGIALDGSAQSKVSAEPLEEQS